MSIDHSDKEETKESEHRRRRSRTGPRRHIGWVVAASLGIGLVFGLLLVAAPFVPAAESELTGALLCGFALGWAMLAVLSVRFSDQPQRWAVVPAVFMGVSGLLLLGFGSSVHRVLSWVWPPVLLVLVVWMIVRSRRELRSRSRPWLLYPVFAAHLRRGGGGYETLGEAADATAYPMPGELIDIGGHSLHLNCTGAGSPTVVLEPGGGLMSSSLGWVAPAVAAHTRVCVYDRGGRGWSEPADTAQDAALIATDLHTLLDSPDSRTLCAGGPFLRWPLRNDLRRPLPRQIAGMVLVDSTQRLRRRNRR